MGKGRQARDAFLEGTITVFAERDDQSRVRDRFDRVFGKVPSVTIEFVEVSPEEPGQVTVYHRGDVITGERVERFLRYAEELTTL